MLNHITLMGRLVRDPELRRTGSGVAVASFRIAVDRDFAPKDGGERKADFITCVAWNKTAEFIGRFFSKGRSIVIIGNLRTRTYDDKNGSKHYVTEVFVDEVQFTFEPKTSQNAQNGGYTPQNSGGGGNYTPSGNAPQNGAQSDFSAGDDSDLFNDDGVPF